MTLFAVCDATDLWVFYACREKGIAVMQIKRVWKYYIDFTL